MANAQRRGKNGGALPPELGMATPANSQTIRPSTEQERSRVYFMRMDCSLFWSRLEEAVPFLQHVIVGSVHAVRFLQRERDEKADVC